MSLNTSMSQSTSFVIDFSEKSTGEKTVSYFTRQHWRNKSLPIVNTNTSQCKLVDNSFSDTKTEPIKMANGSLNFRTADRTKNPNIPPKESEEYESSSDDNDSGGTYTLDKEDSSVQKARTDIGELFGIKENLSNKTNASPKSWSKTILVNEWVEKSSIPSINLSQSLKAPPRLQQNISKIPSPVVARRNLGNNITSINSRKQPFHSPKINVQSKCQDDNNFETEGYLKETENIVSALQRRIDSETNVNAISTDVNRNNSSYNSSPSNRNGTGSTVKTELENPPSITRYNRAFSLRRDRLNKPIADVKTGIPVRQKTLTSDVASTNNSKSICSVSNGDIHRSSLFAHTAKDRSLDSAKFARPDTPLSPKFSVSKQIKQLKKKVTGNNKTTGRSNTTLSSQEIEFQNWKRRKSYDPMKAAAEGKRKSLEKKNSGGALLRSVSTTLSGNNTVLRSASFHATQGPADSPEGYTSAEENEFNYSGKEWKVPKPPSTSLENSPPGSRLSLLSNGSSSSLLYSNFEYGDLTAMTAVAQMTIDVKQTACNLVEKLRHSFSEEHKRSILSNELDNITRYSSNSALCYSANSVLENLKEINRIIQALDQVL